MKSRFLQDQDNADSIEELYEFSLNRYLEKAKKDFGSLEEWSERESAIITKIIYPDLVKKNNYIQIR